MHPETERMLNLLASDSVGQDEATIRAAILLAFRIGNDTAMRSIIQTANSLTYTN